MQFTISDILKLGGKLGIGSVKGYEANKRRLAVVAHDGYGISDFYAENQGKVFATSATVCTLSAAMIYLRRKHGAEAISLWTCICLVSGAVAYLSSPFTTTDEGGPGAVEQAKVYLDNRARHLDQTNPGWEQETINRLSDQVGTINP